MLPKQLEMLYGIALTGKTLGAGVSGQISP